MRPTPSHLAPTPDAPAAIFTSDNEPPADIYIFNSVNPQSPIVSLMATFSFPLFFSLLAFPLNPHLHDRSPSTTPPPTPFISLNWSKGVSPRVLPFSSPPFIFLSPSREPVCIFVRDEISLGRDENGKLKGRRGWDTTQRGNEPLFLPRSIWRRRLHND